MGWGNDISKDFQEEVAYYVLSKQKGIDKSFQVEKKKRVENVLCRNRNPYVRIDTCGSLQAWEGIAHQRYGMQVRGGRWGQRLSWHPITEGLANQTEGTREWPDEYLSLKELDGLDGCNIGERETGWTTPWRNHSSTASIWEVLSGQLVPDHGCWWCLVTVTHTFPR